MSSGAPKCVPRSDRVLKEFIRKLDLGELDGKLSDALKDLTQEDLVRVAEHLAGRR